MRLSLLPLDDRTAPSVSYGGSAWVGTHAEQVFEDWTGPLNTLQSGDLIYVAPGFGGGPRVAVFDLTSGLRARPDYWAADPADRNGVVFVGVPSPAPVPPQHLAAGIGWPVFIDFEAGVDAEAFRHAADLLTPAGLFLTTVRPDLPPGAYGQVVVSSLGWAGGAAGVTAQDWRQTPAWVPKAVYVDADISGPWLGKVIAHEVGHALGLAHRTDGSVMDQGYRPGMVWSDEDLQQLTAAVESFG